MRISRLMMCTFAALAICATNASAQSLKDRLKAKIKNKTDVTTKTDQVMDSAIAKTEHVIKCVVGDDECVKKAKKEGKKVEVVAKDATQQAQTKASGGDVVAKTSTTFVNYDFVPGDRVLFFEDFEDNKVGDPPGRIKLSSGNVEVADVDGNKVMRATSFTTFMLPLREKLPQRFTMEWEEYHHPGWPTAVSFVASTQDEGMGYVESSWDEAMVYHSSGKFASAPATDLSGKWYHVRLMVDGNKSKLYLEGKRVANVADVPFGRANGVWFQGGADDNSPAMYDNIRIAESPTSLFDVLMAKGRVSTHGILFDTNSDQIRAESMPTLQEITGMLKQNPQLKILIEGHTDNVGDDASNLTLSDRRASAVRAYLIKQGIDENRLQSKGFGETKPASPNTTTEGRQQNRRVELVKI